MPYAILLDATRCIDCRACMVACSVENNIPMNDTRIWVSGIGVKGKFPDLERATIPYHCMHCAEPSCASACPVGAWTKRDDGPVVYDSSKCIGCRYCMNACPFGVPHFDYDAGLLDGALIDKCSLCAHRIDAGGQPACTATCPTDAIIFGEHSELLAEAKSRIRKFPDRYVDGVYGEYENGGTSYLVLSHVPFDDLGLPPVMHESVNKNSEKVMSGTIPFALGWTAALTGVAVAARVINNRKAAEDEEPAEEIEE